jgi:hypothetical protein
MLVLTTTTSSTASDRLVLATTLNLKQRRTRCFALALLSDWRLPLPKPSPIDGSIDGIDVRGGGGVDSGGHGDGVNEPTVDEYENLLEIDSLTPKLTPTDERLLGEEDGRQAQEDEKRRKEKEEKETRSLRGRRRGKEAGEGWAVGGREERRVPP